MDQISRLEKFKEIPFDVLLLKIKQGHIKCGKYARFVDKNDKFAKWRREEEHCYGN